MFSIQSYIQEKLNSLLCEYFENLNQNSVHLGLLEGNFSLYNLNFKKFDLNIASGISLSIDKGIIDKLSFNFPWASIRTSDIEGHIDSLKLTCTLKISDGVQRQESSVSTLTNELKMRKVKKEELKILGVASNMIESWFSKSLETFSYSLITKFFSKLVFLVKNVEITIIIPISETNQYALTLKFESLFLDQISNIFSSSSEQWKTIIKSCFLNKEFTLRYFSISMKLIKKNEILDEFECENSQYNALILNPCNITFRTALGKKEVDIISNNSNKIYFDIELSDIDFNFTLEQLLLIKKSVEYIENEYMKLRLFTIRKLIFESEKANSEEKIDSKKAWKFALNAVIYMVRERRRRLEKINLKSAVSRLCLRRRYLNLYRKSIYSELVKRGIVDLDIEIYGISDDELGTLRDLQSTFALKDLILFHTTINKEILQNGIPMSILQDVILGNQSNGLLGKLWFKKKFILNPQHEISSVLSMDNIDSKWIFDIPSVTIAIAINRISLSFYRNVENSISFYQNGLREFEPVNDKIKVHHHKVLAPKKLEKEKANFQRLFTFYCYGFKFILDNAEIDDTLINCKFSHLNLFGFQNHLLLNMSSEMFSTDEISDQMNSAFQLNLKLCRLTDEINQQNETLSYEQRFESKRTTDFHGNIKHIYVKSPQRHWVLESKLGYIKVVFNLLSFIEYTKLSGLFSQEKSLIMCDPYLDEKYRLANLSYYRGLQNYVDEKQKVSVDIVLKSFCVIIPIPKDGNNLAGLDTSKFYSDYLEFRVNKIFLFSGDYIDSYLPNPTSILENWQNKSFDSLDATHKTQTLLEYLAILIFSIRSPIVRPQSFIVEQIFLRYINVDPLEYQSHSKNMYISKFQNINSLSETDRVIIKPWKICGAWSDSNLYSHPDYTDNRLDFFCTRVFIKMDTLDLINILKFSQSCKSLVSSTHSNSSSKIPQNIRLKRLSSLSLFVLTFYLESIELLFVDKNVPVKETIPISIAKKLITNYHDIIKKNSADFDDPILNQINKLRVIRQFKSVGLSMKEAIEFIYYCELYAKDHEKSIGNITDDDFHTILDEMMEDKIQTNLLQQEEGDSQLFRVVIDGFEMKFNKFMYDVRYFAGLKSFSFYDKSRIALVDLTVNKENFNHDFSTNEKSRKNDYSTAEKSHFRVLMESKLNYLYASKFFFFNEISSLEKKYAISFTYIQKDLKYAFAEGGYNLSEVNKDYNIHLKKSKYELIYSIDCEKFYFEYDSKRLFDIIDGLLIVRKTITGELTKTSSSKNLFEQSSTRNPVSEESNRNRNIAEDLLLVENHPQIFNIRINSIDLLISNDQVYFSFIRLDGIRINILTKNCYNELSFSSENLRLIDLSLGGQLHRDILWKKNPFRFRDSNYLQAISLKIIEITDPISPSLSINFHCHDLMVCFLYRFILDFVDVIKDLIIKPIQLILPSNDVVGYNNSDYLSDTSSIPEENNIRSDNLNPNIQTTQEPNSSHFPSKTIYISGDISNLVGFVPRNSLNNDIIGLTIQKAEIIINGEKDMIMAPQYADFQSNSLSNHIFYNTEENCWQQGISYNDHFEESCSTENLEAKINNFPEFDDIDNLNFFDAKESGPDIQLNFSKLPVTRIIARLYHAEIFTTLNTSFKWKKEKSEESKLSYKIFDLPSPLKSSIAHNSCVFINNINDPRFNINQKWFENSRSPLNLQMILDLSDTETKLVFGDTKQFSSLNLATSMAELYLLIALWFDNCHEDPLYMSQLEEYTIDMRTKADILQEPELSTEPNVDSHNVYDNNIDSYGGENYINYIFNRNTTFEIMVIKSDANLACALETNYFKSNIPNIDYTNQLQSFDREIINEIHEYYKIKSSKSNYEEPIKGEKDKRSNLRMTKKVVGNYTQERKVIPLANVHCKAFILSAKTDVDVTQLFISVGKTEVHDGRMPNKSSLPLLLRIAPSYEPTTNIDFEYKPAFEYINDSGNLKYLEVISGKFHYGFLDFKYGFEPNKILTDLIPDVPLQFTLVRSALSNWMSMNLGLDNLDLHLNQIDICLLLSDYFSCYFRFSEFGHPGVASYYQLDDSKIPYGATDFRLFITRPHICVISNPLLISSPFFFLEAESGIYFRVTMDTMFSTKYFLNINDLALVLAKSFRPSNILRGARGSSGSGRGIRTAIEFLNIFFRYHFDAITDQIDFNVNISSPDLLSQRELILEFQSLDIGKYTLENEPIDIPEPTCLVPLIRTHELFVQNPCNIVTCFEDILFLVQSIQTIFSDGTDSNLNSEDVLKEKQENHRYKELLRTFGIINISGIRALFVDNVLGMHLPLFQMFFKDFECSFDRTEGSDEIIPSYVIKKVPEHRRTFSMNFNSYMEGIGLKSQDPEIKKDEDEIKLFTKMILWGEYFNNLKKCWEPLFERISLNCNYEKSRNQGVGLMLKLDSAFHVNLTGALIRTTYDTLRTINLENGTSSHLKQGNIDIYELENSQTKNISFNDWGEDISINNSTVLNANTPVNKGPFSIRGDPILSFTSEQIDHRGGSSLDPKVRVGFSILNLTGQPVRYLQRWEGGKRSVQYINHGERGLLNFVASQTLIRNSKVVEETFGLQLDRNCGRDSNQRRIVGNKVALQVSGYRWLHSVQADELGVHFEDLFPVLGRVRASRAFGDLKKIANTLKLMVEVIPYCGGRMLRLRSAFTIRNNTKHRISILAKNDGADLIDSHQPLQDIPFELEAGEDLYLPLALLHQNVISSRGTSLGLLYIKPTHVQPIEEEFLTGLDIFPGSVDYSTDPMNLFQIAERSMNPSFTNNINSGVDINQQRFSNPDLIQLCCHVQGVNKNIRNKRHNGKSNSPMTSIENKDMVDFSFQDISSNKLPPFCYCVEVIKSSMQSTLNNPQDIDDGNSLQFPPASFTLVIHPPIIIENLLPVSAVFELIHPIQKRVVWSSTISAKEAKPVHTITLDEPLSLLINLRYCRASEGVLIHQPKKNLYMKNGLAKTLQKAVDSFLEDTENDGISYIDLTDTVGQKLRLNIENTEGGGGERRIVVYCPYWIVNLSQYAFRIREEGEIDLPAGTVTLLKDGTRPVPMSSLSLNNPIEENFSLYDSHQVQTRDPFSTPHERSRFKRSDSVNMEKTQDTSKPSSSKGVNISTVFPGCCGPLHQSFYKEFEFKSSLTDLLYDLNFAQLQGIAYLFNFKEESGLLNNNKKVKIQLDDSDWSRSFSLDGVGVNQVLSIEHSTKGMMEVGFKVNVAPGKLSKYTKIIKILPRYVFVNRLKHSLKVLQPQGFGDEYIDIDVSAEHLRAYHLPALFGERTVSLQVDGHWEKSIAFSIDQIGVFSLRVRRYIDLASIAHVNTRGAPEYIIELPHSKLIGLAFETDWDEENIVVKALQPGSFAARETDIKVGDVLLAVDEEYFSGKEFEAAMSLLKSKLATSSCVIKLRTIEEKLRLIRDSAFESSLRERRRSTSFVSPNFYINSPQPGLHSRRMGELPEDLYLRIDVKQVDSNVMIVVNQFDPVEGAEYRIENRSVCYFLHYKQKGISGNNWNTLGPGQSSPFIWEDPFKPHKLIVNAGENILTLNDLRNKVVFSEGESMGDKGKGDDTLGTYLSYIAGVNNESGTILNLDEIGSKEYIPLHKPESSLIAIVKSEGPTKILIITTSENKIDLIREFQYSVELIYNQIKEILELTKGLKDFEKLFSKDSTDDIRIGSIEILINEFKINSIKTIKETQKSILNDPNQNSVIFKAPLVSEKPFERLFESGIEQKNQILIDILEAKELAPLVLGKVEDVYCKVYIRNNENLKLIDRGINSQTYYTYVFDQSLNPKWLNQRFVFNTTESARDDYRSYSIRIMVKAKSVLGVDNVLAKLDVPFSCLKDEKTLEGWFPLRPSVSSVLASKIPGSIKLRLRWIYSDLGFLKYFFDQSEKRIKDLSFYLNSQLSILAFHNKTMDSRDPFYFENTSKYFNLMKDLSQREIKDLNFAKSLEEDIIHENDRSGNLPLESLSITPPKKTRFLNSNTIEELLKDDDNDIISKRLTDLEIKDQALGTPNISQEPLLINKTLEKKDSKVSLLKPKISFEYLELTPRSFSSPNKYAHSRNISNWIKFCKSNSELHELLSIGMKRSESVSIINDTFRDNFIRESQRAFTHVFTQNGQLEVMPMQALHLPESKSYLHIKISYGIETFRTHSVSPAAFLTWYQDDTTNIGAMHYHSNGDVETPLSGASYHSDPNEISYNGNKSFDIDMLNIRGEIKIRIMAEGFPKSHEVARIEIPVYGIVNCACVLDQDQWYDKWFPLRLTKDKVLGNDEMATFNVGESSEQSTHSKFGYSPCIRIRFKWKGSQQIQSIENPLFYSHIKIPSFSVSIVDSYNSRTVLLATIIGTEIRQAETKDKTDTSIVVSTLQVDNQLPDPICAVILSPTIVKSPQPVVRIHFRKKNLLSQKNLVCFETIQMVFQELDLKLEQQTVLASWELIKGWLKERKQGKLGVEVDVNQQNEILSIDDEILMIEPEVSSNYDNIFSNILKSRTKVQKENSTNFPDNRGRQKKDSQQHYNTLNVSPQHLFPKQENQIKDLTNKTFLDDEAVSKLYIENFKIFPIKINVSFLTSPQYILEKYRKEKRSHISSTTDNNNVGIMSAVSIFLWQVGEVVLDLTSNISDAPIYFNGFEAPHLFKTSHDVTRILQDHYLHSALGQLYKIVVSLDLVGNPIGLLSSLSVGVRDFFYEPAHALIKGPTEFRKIGKGVVKGTVSLVSNTTVGFLGTGTTITRSIGRGVAKLSMDTSYIRTREKLQKNPGTVQETISRPIKDISNGLYFGVVGLVRVPYNSVKRHGPLGLVPGVAKGVAGLAADPIVGILDAVTHSGDACREIIKNVNKERAEVRRPIRLGDLFGPDGRLLPYDYQVSLGNQLLCALERIKEDTSEHFNHIRSDQNTNEGFSSPAFKLLSKSRDDMVPVERRTSIRESALSSTGKRGSREDFKSQLSPVNSLSRRPSMHVKSNRFSITSRNLSTSNVSLDGLEDISIDADSQTKLRQTIANSPEFVIHTSIFHKTPYMDLVVVLSSQRLIITEYHRKQYGSYLKKKWGIKLSNLALPILERSGGGATLILKHSNDQMKSDMANSFLNSSSNVKESTSKKIMTHLSSVTKSKSKVKEGKYTDRSFQLTGNYQEEDIIKNLYNCIHTILGSNSSLFPIQNQGRRILSRQFDSNILIQDNSILHTPLQQFDMNSTLGSEDKSLNNNIQSMADNSTFSISNYQSSFQYFYEEISNICTEDEYNIRHIGPWQFSRNHVTEDSFFMNEDKNYNRNEIKVLQELDKEPWHFIPSDEYFLPKHGIGHYQRPQWLILEEKACIQSHNMVRSIYETCRLLEEEANFKHNTILLTHIDALYKGSISIEEFKNYEESTKRLFLENMDDFSAFSNPDSVNRVNNFEEFNKSKKNRKSSESKDRRKSILGFQFFKKSMNNNQGNEIINEHLQPENHDIVNHSFLEFNNRDDLSFHEENELQKFLFKREKFNEDFSPLTDISNPDSKSVSNNNKKVQEPNRISFTSVNSEKVTTVRNSPLFSLSKMFGKSERASRTTSPIFNISPENSPNELFHEELEDALHPDRIDQMNISPNDNNDAISALELISDEELDHESNKSQNGNKVGSFEGTTNT